MKIKMYGQVVISLLFFISILSIQCTPDAEKKINSGIELYNKEEVANAKEELESGLFAFSSKNTLDDNPKISIGYNVIYKRHEDSLIINYPIKVEINIDKNYKIIYYDPDSKRLVLSNGIDINIYNNEGLLTKVIATSIDDKNKVKSVILINDKLLYFREKRVYVYDYATNNHKLLTKERFFCPVKGSYYIIKFHKTKSAIAIIIGMAGVYNMSVLDTIDSSILLKNHRISSSKLLFNDDNIYYITGKTGKWTLRKISIRSKKRTKLLEFDDLLDVEFSDAGFLYENRNGLWLYDYSSKKPEKIPFQFELAGICNGRPLIKNRGKIYPVNMKIFIDKIAYLKRVTPALFAE